MAKNKDFYISLLDDCLTSSKANNIFNALGYTYFSAVFAVFEFPLLSTLVLFFAIVHVHAVITQIKNAKNR